MGVSWIRYPYTSFMRFYRDSDVLTPVCWYFTHPGAKSFPHYTRFATGFFDQHAMSDWEGVGEAPFCKLEFGSRAQCCEGEGQEYIGTPDQFARGILYHERQAPQELLDRCPPCLTYGVPQVSVSVLWSLSVQCNCCCDPVDTYDGPCASGVTLRGFGRYPGKPGSINGNWNPAFGAFQEGCENEWILANGVTLLFGVSHDNTTNIWNFHVTINWDLEVFATYSLDVADFDCSCQDFVLPLVDDGTDGAVTIAPTVIYHTCMGLDDGGTKYILTEGRDVIAAENTDRLTQE